MDSLAAALKLILLLTEQFLSLLPREPVILRQQGVMFVFLGCLPQLPPIHRPETGVTWATLLKTLSPLSVSKSHGFRWRLSKYRYG